MSGRFRIVLGNHAAAAGLKSGAVTVAGGALDFVDYPVTNHAFKPMVREQAFDICEMAITTLILARAHGRKLHFLPAALVGRMQHDFAAVRTGVEMAGPADVAGKRIGVRAYTQTTVTWLRGVLGCDLGADLSAARWISFEDNHVPESADPTERAPAGRKIDAMLEAGEIDIALGLKASGPHMQPLFDADAPAAWIARHGCIQVNHVVAVTEDMVTNHLDTLVDLYNALGAGKPAHSGPGPDPLPQGFAALRAPLGAMLDYMQRLDMLPGPMSVDDLIDPRLRAALGD